MQPSAPVDNLTSSAPIGMATTPAPDRGDVCHIPALASPTPAQIGVAAPALTKQSETLPAKRATPNINSTQTGHSLGMETGVTPHRRGHDENRSHIDFGLSLDFGPSVPSLPKPALTATVAAANRTHNSTPSSDRTKRVDALEPARRGVLSSETAHRDPHITRRGSAGDRNFPISRQDLELEILSLTALNKQLQESLKEQHGVDTERFNATQAQVALLTDELEVTRIRCATLEEQNRLLASERSSIRDELILCKEELLRERSITTSVISGKSEVLDIPAKELSKVAAPSTVEFQLSAKLEELNSSAETAKVQYLERINNLESSLENKTLEVARYHRLNQDLKAEVEELRARHRFSLSASSELEHRISEELQEEMGIETKRMDFLENENKKLKDLLALRTSEVEDLMKEVDDLVAPRIDVCPDSSVSAQECPTEDIEHETESTHDVELKAELQETHSATENSQVKSLRGDLERAQQELVVARKRIEALELENSTLENTLNSDRDRMKELERKLSELKVESRHDILQLNAVEEELENKYRMQTAEISRLVSSTCCH